MALPVSEQDCMCTGVWLKGVEKDGTAQERKGWCYRIAKMKRGVWVRQRRGRANGML